MSKKTEKTLSVTTALKVVALTLDEVPHELVELVGKRLEEYHAQSQALIDANDNFGLMRLLVEKSLRVAGGDFVPSGTTKDWPLRVLRQLFDETTALNALKEGNA
jgi:hypothetical protein